MRAVKRNDNSKSQLKWDGLAETISASLTSIHTEMYEKALKARLEHTKNIDNWKDFMDAMAARNICMAPWCNVQQCEKDVKEKSKEESLKAMEEGDQDEVQLTGAAKTLCIPIEQPKLKEG